MTTDRFGFLPPELRRHTRIPLRGADILGSSFVITALSLALPLALLQIYDRIIPNDSRETLHAIVIGVGVAIVLEAVLRLGRSYLTGHIAMRFEQEAADDAFDKVLGADLSEFQKTPVARYQERFHAITALREFAAGQFLLNAIDFGFGLVYVGLVAFLGGWLAVIPLAAAGLMFASTAFYAPELVQKAEIQSQTEEKRTVFLVSAMRGLLAIKSWGAERILQRRYEQMQESRARTTIEIAQDSQRLQDLAGAIGQVAVAALVAAGAMRVMSGDMTVGGLAACTLLVGRSLQPLQSVVGLWRRMQSAQLSQERAVELFRIPPRKTHAPFDDPDLAIEGEIRIADVAFRPAGASHPLFDGAEFSVKAGDTVGITGPNGSGKSLLLHMIRGFVEPQSGTIEIDGRPLASYPHEVLARDVAYIPQTEHLFRGTIMDNLTLFREGYEREAIGLAERLGLADIIGLMPQGFRTPIGEGADTQLPRGLAQRICIARGLVVKPRILLFDEPNTAVDDAADVAIRDLLHALHGECTTVLVSHRPSILRLATSIYGFSGGVLAEQAGQRAAESEGDHA